MTPQAMPARSTQPATADLRGRLQAANPADHPLSLAPALPRSDASEPAELTPIVVRGYN